MTKKELLEAIKDMPEDAEIYLRGFTTLPIENLSIEEIKGRDVICLHPYPIIYAC